MQYQRYSKNITFRFIQLTQTNIHYLHMCVWSSIMCLMCKYLILISFAVVSKLLRVNVRTNCIAIPEEFPGNITESKNEDSKCKAIRPFNKWQPNHLYLCIHVSLVTLIPHPSTFPAKGTRISTNLSVVLTVIKINHNILTHPYNPSTCSPTCVRTS